MSEPQKLMEVGAVANTHGVRGELKIESRCDSPDFLRRFAAFVIGGKSYNVVSLRIHKNAAITLLEGIDTVQAAQALKGLTVLADVSGVRLPEGRFFIADLIGLPVIENGTVIGRLADVLTLPAHDVYVLDNGRMIPNVPEFVLDINESGITVSLIEGM